MHAINEYLDKCLAECPEGAEDLLLGELARRLLQKYGPHERIEVRSRDGLVGYFMPAFIDIEGLPPEMREIALRETDANEPRLSAEEFDAWVDAAMEKESEKTEQKTTVRSGASS